MSNEIEQFTETVAKEIYALPEEKRKAVYWIINNIDLVDKLTDGEKLSEAEADMVIAKAKNRNDYLTWAITLYKQEKDKAKTDITQQEN